MPVAELESAFPGLAISGGKRLTETQRSMLLDYASRHIWLEGADGKRWSLQRASASLEIGPDHQDVRYLAVYARPPIRNSGSFRLRYDAITHQVMSHVVLVFIRGDFSSSTLEREPQLIGMLQNPVDGLGATISNEPAPGVFGNAVKMGIGHIVKGYDHILFLLSLIFALPLVKTTGGWDGGKPFRRTLLALAKVVTAFTIGHSTSLIFAVMLDWRLPTAFVELCVAATVLVAAVNIWKPVFAHREVVAAGLFGLVHGMAFSGAIGQHMLDPGLKFQVVLGFNIGIEAVQLILAAAAIAPLWAMASSAWFARFKASAAILIGSTAGFWLIERALVFQAELSEISILDEPRSIAAMGLLLLVALLACWFASNRKSAV